MKKWLFMIFYAVGMLMWYYGFHVVVDLYKHFEGKNPTGPLVMAIFYAITIAVLGSQYGYLLWKEFDRRKTRSM